MYLWIFGAILVLCIVSFLWKKNLSSQSSPIKAETKYYEDIEKYITSMGFYEKLLEIEGTDKEYCIAAMKVRKAGYLSGQSEKVVGALIMDSASKYNNNREVALMFLESVEKQLSDAS